MSRSVVLPSAGTPVAWWSGHDLRIALYVGEEKRRLCLVGANGKRSRVPHSRLAFALEPETHGEDEAAIVRALEERVVELARRCDVPALWELASEAAEPFELEPLAELALEGRSGVQRAALIRALLDDRIHFVRRGERWAPRPAEAVRELQVQREQTRLSEERQQAFLDGMRALARGESWAPADDPVAERFVDALEQLAVHDLEASDQARATALTALAAWGGRHDHPAEGAFRVLRALGRIASDDENLDLRRFEIESGFPPDVLAAAERAAAAGFDRAGRIDLTGLPAFTIDGSDTTEIDDALSVEPDGQGGLRLGVHIADPGAFVALDDPLDRAASGRGITYYLPDRKIMMLPPAISEAAASLVAGEERPAISLSVALDERGRVGEWEFARSVVRSRERLTFQEVDRRLAAEDDPRLRLLSAVLRERRQRRLDAGAVPIDVDEVDLRAVDGRITLERLRADSPARLLIGEAMVLTGELSARFCRDGGVPALFRRQAPPSTELAAPPLPCDPVTARRLRMQMRRGETGPTAGPHFALGLPVYLQATSPLRRYHDLVNQRQIVAVLAGEPPPYTETELRQLAIATSRAERTSRVVERAARRYWTLRHLEARVGERLDATLVDGDPKPVAVLEETCLEQTVHALRGRTPGERLSLTVQRVNPRAGVLVLRPQRDAP